MFEMGIVPDSSFLMYEFYPEDDRPYFYSEFEIETRFGYDDTYLFIIGGIRTDFIKYKSNYTFFPINDTYSIEAGGTYKDITLGVRHLCTHPVFPYISFYGDHRPIVKYEGSYNEIYFRIKHEFKK